MLTLGKFLAVLLWIPLLMWAGGSEAWEMLRGVPPPPPFEAGVTFSSAQAKTLGLDPQETYRAILDDLGVRRLRLIAYWEEVEPRPGAYEFSSLDFQIKEAEKRGAKTIVALGMKLPRWPECHMPEWARQQKDVEKALFQYIERVVERYKNVSAIEMWQVENEPFYKFGECPEISHGTIKKEVEFVRHLDSRPILITDSGELGTWIGAARFGDVVGTTMYRRNLTPLGYMSYPLPARFYEAKAKLVEKIFSKKVIVIEMQGEPWMRSPNPADFPIEEQFRGLDFSRFQQHLAYARASRLSPVYFWGVEWWYWLKKNTHPEFWDYSRTHVFSK